jgi:hypothetical protein
MTELMLDQAVREAKLLVDEIVDLDIKETPPLWRLADLSAASTHKAGRPGVNSGLLTISEWAEQIGWSPNRGMGTLTAMVKVARGWPEELRVEGASFWQHYEARKAFDTVEEASEWLTSLLEEEPEANVTATARSGVLGTGPIFKAIRALMKARKEIVRVPGILAKADALGTEPNFDMLRAEVARLKRGMEYLDRFLADEFTIDMDEFQAGLDEILKEEA